MSKAKKPKWCKGPPPSIGWWPASVVGNKHSLRWWNGQYWSMGCVRGMKIDAVENMANRPSIFDQRDIEWTDRPKNWPARSYT